ncbi:hypothetical protein [Bifidobacterium adolescentis]|uniref:Hypoyhetical protein n=1 Tax=Bifidobacterium adolescentis TaxID=1680 RepID=A0A174ANB3_BIFAD|nr:hypothetical protein [Bifidobacterium adolescentis]CUN89090.1 Uncharacterised protein [Bifidobacterium adolescentis]
MTLRRIDAETLLTPPEPPKPPERRSCTVLLATSGFIVRVNGDGSTSLVDGIQEITLAEFTAEESKDIIHTLINMIGGTR